MPNLKRTHRMSGFTLIELMITVALIGVLASLAIPNFLAYQAKSRRGEALMNLSGIGRVLKSYHAETGIFPDTLSVAGEPVLPVGAPGPTKLNWDAQTDAFFGSIGFEPEGAVAYQYGVSADSDNCACTQCFTAWALGDSDGDGSYGAVLYVHPQFDGSGAVVGSCQTDIFGWSGPVDRYGAEIFDSPVARPPVPGDTDDF